MKCCIAPRLLLALAAAAAVIPGARALSWPLCDNGGQVRERAARERQKGV